MPKVSDEYRESRRDEIADAALRVFVAKGFQGTSIADIIHESGLSAGAIYGHFASKQEIMMAVARRIMTRRDGEIQELEAKDRLPAPIDMLAQMLRGVADDLSGTRLLVQVWGASTFDPEVKKLAAMVIGGLRVRHLNYLALWARREKGMSDSDAEAWATGIAPMLMALGQGYIVQSTMFDDFDGEAYLAAAKELLPH